jgi:hypothetical protein
MRNAVTRYDFLIPDFSDQLVARLAVIFENGLDLGDILSGVRIGLVNIRVKAGHDFARRFQPESVHVVQHAVGYGAHQDQQKDEQDHNNPGIVHLQCGKKCWHGAIPFTSVTGNLNAMTSSAGCRAMLPKIRPGDG